MNDQLLQQDYSSTIAIVFVVGLIMFLLPPVPGVPVYIFCGIVLAKQRPEVTFATGCTIAVLLGLILKLCACCGQYLIGYFAGRSVKIQKLIGVDTKPTRAIEAILTRPETYSLGKVAILVGGPDWP